MRSPTLPRLLPLLLLLTSLSHGEVAFPIQLPRLASGGASTGMCLVRGALHWAPAICFQGLSQSFTPASGTTITFPHNLNTLHLRIRVFDSSNNFMIPKDARILDANTVIVYLDTAMTGRVVVK